MRESLGWEAEGWCGGLGLGAEIVGELFWCPGGERSGIRGL